MSQTGTSRPDSSLIHVKELVEAEENPGQARPGCELFAALFSGGIHQMLLGLILFGARGEPPEHQFESVVNPATFILAGAQQTLGETARLVVHEFVIHEVKRLER